jgi:hypothetical protein
MSLIRRRMVLAEFSAVSTITKILTLFGEVWGGFDGLVSEKWSSWNEAPKDRLGRDYHFTLMGLASPSSASTPSVHADQQGGSGSAPSAALSCRRRCTAMILWCTTGIGNARQMQMTKVTGTSSTVSAHLYRLKRVQWGHV